MRNRDKLEFFMPTLRRILVLITTCLIVHAGERPKIGLALGGGGALGLAHVGVLLWLERHHIPVDTIAGTSMGALIAGTYATGLSATDVDTLIRGIDWDAAFRGNAPFSDLRFRRKQDRLAFPNHYELGLKHGVSGPSGVTSGFGLNLLLDRLFLSIPANQSFDKLATPFRCISTDLVSGDRIEISDGPLGLALRASSAIPGYFEPVRLAGQVLVDGGIVDNLPVDSARAMGADIVIASVLPVAALKPDEIQGLGVLGRSVSIAIVQNERQSEKKAQIVITPDVGNFSSTDYAQFATLIAKGIEGADAQKNRLLPYALNDADWDAFVKARELSRIQSTPRFQHVEVSGGTHSADHRLEKVLTAAMAPGKGTIDSKQIDPILFREIGTGLYNSAGYSSRTNPDGSETLDVTLFGKLHGPPFIYVNPEVSGDAAGRTLLTVNSRFVFMDVGSQNAELRADLSIGSHTLAAVEYYHPIAGTGWFWAPRAAFDRRESFYYVSGSPRGDFDIRQAGVGFDFGYTTVLNNEVRLGVDYGRIGGDVQTGFVPLAGQDGVVKSAKLQFTHNGQDSEQVPSRGLRISAIGRYYFDAPVSSRFPLVKMDASWFHPITREDRVFLLATGASSFGNQLPVPLQFTLGGPLRLGAYGLDEFRGDRIAYASAGWLHRIGTLPAVLGGNLFLGGWYETGGYSLAEQQTTWRQNGTIAFVAETPLGPFYTGWSLGHTAHEWNGKFTFLV
ncbi:MAG TPA: patatin-like phospholipase family protein, partial [Bryobacteraceae bacterium]